MRKLPGTSHGQMNREAQLYSTYKPHGLQSLHFLEGQPWTLHLYLFKSVPHDAAYPVLPTFWQDRASKNPARDGGADVSRRAALHAREVHHREPPLVRR